MKSSIFKVIEYNPTHIYHTVKGNNGEIRRLDLMVNGDFPEGTKPESIVGQWVSWDRDFPYISIARNARVVYKPEE